MDVIDDQNITWISLPASKIIAGHGSRIRQILLDDNIKSLIENIAGPGDRLWWRSSDVNHESIQKHYNNWGWSFDTHNRLYTINDWMVDLWFKNADHAILVKLALI